MSERRTFAAFIRTCMGQAKFLPDGFLDRIELSSTQINCLRVLQAWSRERWPRWYARRGGTDNDGPTGKQIIDSEWAAYLAWAEIDQK